MILMAPMTGIEKQSVVNFHKLPSSYLPTHLHLGPSTWPSFLTLLMDTLSLPLCKANIFTCILDPGVTPAILTSLFSRIYFSFSTGSSTITCKCANSSPILNRKAILDIHLPLPIALFLCIPPQKKTPRKNCLHPLSPANIFVFFLNLTLVQLSSHYSTKAALPKSPITSALPYHPIMNAHFTQPDPATIGTLILFSPLQTLSSRGSQDTKLSWFSSYLTGHSFLASFANSSSSPQSVNHGELQGSDLRLPSIYTNFPGRNSSTSPYLLMIPKFILPV